MLLELRIKNFKCLRQLTLDLRYGLSKAPNGYKESNLLSFVGDGKSKAIRAVPTLGIFGPNAAGKTTIIQAVLTLKRIVCDRFEPDFFQPNKINSNQQETQTSTLAATFYGLSRTYDFHVKYNQMGIVEEYLSINGIKEYFVDDSHLQINSPELQNICLNLNNAFQTRCIDSRSKRQVRTLLRCLQEEFPGIREGFIYPFDFFASELHVLPNNNVPAAAALEWLAGSCQGKTLQEKRKSAVEAVSDLLKKMDSKIEGFNYRLIELPTGNERIYDIAPSSSYRYDWANNKLEKFELETYHKADDGSNAKFDFHKEESRGTQRILSLTALFLWALKTGKVLLIDELESSLHPLLLLSLVNMFKRKSYNTHNAQLIFTTHNTELLESEVLKLSEVALLDPRSYGRSSIMRLSSIEGLRNANNFRRRYMRGDFGGIPFPVL